MTGAYARQPVLVIGGLGYIGSNLTDALLGEAAVVTVVTRERGAQRAMADRFAVWRVARSRNHTSASAR